MIRRMIRLAMRPMRKLLALPALLLAACGNAPSPTYFPLNPGLHWEYAVHERSALVDNIRPLSVRNLAPMKRDGQEYARRLYSDGNEYWLWISDGELMRGGVRTAIDFAPKMDPTPRMVMPIPPAVGQLWTLATRPYILERREPFRERFSNDESKRIELTMKIAALDDVVVVPAGRFERCLRIEGQGLLHVLADARLGASPVPVTHTEWYAPGVGLLKLVRSEALDTQQIVGGEVTMELLRFDD